MENASKALIIAGAIIISILVIGLGVFIFSGASENADVSSSMNSQKAQAHNGTFTNYFGQKVSANKVKELMKQIVTNNATAETADEKAKIYIHVSVVKQGTMTVGDTTATDVTGWVKSGYTYAVNVANDSGSDTDAYGDGYYKSGYIKSIEIKENNKS